MVLGEPPADRYRCSTCGDHKTARGCGGPVEKILWVIPYCPVCGGANEQCFLCGGRNEIAMHRCPRAYDGRILPFFIPYYSGNCISWPDGRGRLFQPTKLTAAFDILSLHFRRMKNGC